MSDPLHDLPEGGLPDEFRRGVAFAELCYRQAETDWAEAMALARAGAGVAVVSWPRLVSALEQHRTAAGQGHAAALAEARREAAWLVLTARDTPAGAVMATLDRLAASVDTLATERDRLRYRIARALAELDAAPDVDPDRAGKRAMREVLQANTRAWAVLAEGRDPPSKRRAEDAPRDPDGGDCSRPTSPAGDAP